MKIKISATFEGKCSLCGEDSVVFTVGDEETKRAVTVCKACADRYSDMTTEEMVEKHGTIDEAPFQPAVKFEGKKAQ